MVTKATRKRKPKPRAYVGTINELSKVLGNTHQHLYRREKAGDFKREKRGYHVETIRKALLLPGSQLNGHDLNTREEAQKWEKEYRKWRALKAKREYAESIDVLIDKNKAISEMVRRETQFVRELKRLQFSLPPKLKNVAYELWPGIIDQSIAEALRGIIEHLEQSETT